MARIHNPTIRMFHLPTIPPGEDGEQPGPLFPGATLEVTDGYLKALLKKKDGKRPSGWAARLEVQKNRAMVREPEGVAGAFAARIKGKRKSDKAKKDKGELANEATNARLEALENEAASSKGASAKA